MDEQAIRKIRDASIVVSVRLNVVDNAFDEYSNYEEPESVVRAGPKKKDEKEDEITITTEDGNNNDAITLIPGAEINITNPINRELTSVISYISPAV